MDEGPTHRKCPKCLERKIIQDFAWVVSRYTKKRYRGPVCYICTNNKAKILRDKNPDKYVEYQNKHKENNRDLVLRRKLNTAFKKKYGITVEARDAMIKAQNNTCLICKRPNKGGKNWHVDHDHRSGAVRGILCHLCNVMIGFSREDTAILRNAIKYLEEHNAVPTHDNAPQATLCCVELQQDQKL